MNNLSLNPRHNVSGDIEPKIILEKIINKQYKLMKFFHKIEIFNSSVYIYFKHC